MNNLAPRDSRSPSTDQCSHLGSDDGRQSKKRPHKHKKSHKHDTKRYHNNHRSRSRSRSSSRDSDRGHDRSAHHRSSRSHKDRHRSPSSHHPYASTSNSYGHHFSSSVPQLELRIQAISTQLTLSQNRVSCLESELLRARSGQSSSAQQLMGLKANLEQFRRENTALLSRNDEIVSVMKTLEEGVKTYQAENAGYLTKSSELERCLRGKDEEIALLKEQLGKFQERNKVLADKCGAMLAGQEKLKSCESEMERVKSEMKEAQTLMDEYKAVTSRIATFEVRERLWINEKAELESKLREVIESEAATRQKLHRLQEEGRVRLVEEETKKDHLVLLHAAVESLNSLHQSEMERIREALPRLHRQQLEGDGRSAIEDRANPTVNTSPSLNGSAATRKRSAR